MKKSLLPKTSSLKSPSQKSTGSSVKSTSAKGASSGGGITSLTTNERNILTYIESEIVRTGISPSYQEICQHFGFASFNSVQNYVKQLSKKGYLRAHPHQKRGLEVLKSATAFQNQTLKQVSKNATTESPRDELLQVPMGIRPIPLLGRVAAGAPIERMTDNETLQVPPQLMKDPEQSYALCVSGDSMIEEGIHDGDWIIVHKREVARNGDLVVASIQGPAGPEATVKRIYFHPKNGPDEKVELRPSNSQLASQWYAESQVNIRGHVTGLIRKF
ncbi:MAG: transcriptional repressor LexA [Bdellovibrionales bacterium]